MKSLFHQTQPLKLTTRHSVIDAYSRSLRIVFISAIVAFVIVNILVFAIQLPHLKKKEADAENEDERGTGGRT
jgi:ABC-type spermidine/putrescine transport system permease subunit II